MGKVKKVEKKSSKAVVPKASEKKVALVAIKGKAAKTSAVAPAPIKKLKDSKSKAPLEVAPIKAKGKTQAELKAEAGKTESAKQALKTAKSGEMKAPSKTKASEKSELQAVLSKKGEQVPATFATPPVEKKQKKVSAAAARKAAEAQEDLTNAGKKWLGLYNQLKNSKTKPYDMSASFDVKSGIQHNVLGWGYVVETRGDRMDVLFKDGMKTLVINYMKG